MNEQYPESISDFSVRQAMPDDFAVMALIQERAMAGRDNLPLPTVVSPGAVRSIVQRSELPQAWANVAINGADVAGFALGYPSDDETEYVSLLMVDPSYWGRRLASRLLDAAGQEALARGRQRVTLWTNKYDNTRARSVYEHKGFSTSGRLRQSPYGVQVEYERPLR